MTMLPLMTNVTTTTTPHLFGTGTAVVAGLLYVVYFVWRRIIRHRLEVREPFPGQLPMSAGSHWFFGHLSMFGNDFTTVHRRLCYDSANEYGMCSFWLTGCRGVSLTQARHVRAILQASVEHSVVPIMKLHFGQFLGRRNIGTLNGKEWKYHRAAILRVFHSSSTLMSSRQAVVDVTQTVVESLKQQQQQPVFMDIEPLMKMITMDVFGRTALSCDFECCTKLQPSPFAVAFDFLGKDFIRRLRSPLWPTHVLYGWPTALNRRNAQERTMIRTFLHRAVETRRMELSHRRGEKKDQKRGDLLTSLLKAHDDLLNGGGGDAAEVPGQVVTDETLVDILMSLLFAGYDTTSITLMYALYIVASHPEVERKCLEEIERVYKEDGNLSNPDRLVYCGGVIQETLRMYPPGFVVSRKATKPLELSGFVIPKDTFVLIPIYMIQHDPNHFERPEAFHAERWVKKSNDDDKEDGAWVERGMDDDDDTDKSNSSSIAPGNRNAIFAFSGGARSCAAQKFATQEAVLVLANLVKELKFGVKPGYVPVPKRNGIVQSPAGGMPMTITPRNK